VTAQPKLKFLDTTLYTIVMNTGLRWLPVAAAVGPAALPLWLVALVVFFIPLATATAELTGRFEGEGGIYSWVRETYGPLAGFLCGFFYWFGLMPYFAGILYFLSGLLMAALGLDPHNTALYLGFSIVLAVLVTAVQFVGLSVSKWLPSFGTIASWLIFFALAAIALFVAAHGHSATDFRTSSYRLPLNFDTAILWGTIVFAYSGIEAVAFLKSEIEGGMRTILRVLAIVGVAIAILYVVGTAAMLVILPASQMTRLGGFADVLHAVFAAGGIAQLAPFAIAFLALSMLGGLTAWFGAGARLLFAGGMDNVLPPWLAHRSARTGAPIPALVLQGGLMIVMVILGQAGASAQVAYDFLVSMSVLTNTICYVFVFAVYLRLHRTETAGWRPPGGATTGLVLGVMGQTATLVAIACTLVPSAGDAHPLQTFAKIAIATLAMVVVGVVLYWLAANRRPAERVVSGA
jgi:amino acid transporter